VTDRRAKAIAAGAGGSVTDPGDGREYEVVTKSYSHCFCVTELSLIVKVIITEMRFKPSQLLDMPTSSICCSKISLQL